MTRKLTILMTLLMITSNSFSSSFIVGIGSSAVSRFNGPNGMYTCEDEGIKNEQIFNARQSAIADAQTKCNLNLEQVSEFEEYTRCLHFGYTLKAKAQAIFLCHDN